MPAPPGAIDGAELLEDERGADEVDGEDRLGRGLHGDRPAVWTTWTTSPSSAAACGERMHRLAGRDVDRAGW